MVHAVKAQANYKKDTSLVSDWIHHTCQLDQVMDTTLWEDAIKRKLSEIDENNFMFKPLYRGKLRMQKGSLLFCT